MLLSRQLANFTRGESDALRKAMGKKEKLVLEVSLEIGDNVVRTIAMSSTDGLNRGAEVVDYRSTNYSSCR